MDAYHSSTAFFFVHGVIREYRLCAAGGLDSFFSLFAVKLRIPKSSVIHTWSFVVDFCRRCVSVCQGLWKSERGGGLCEEGGTRL